MLHFTATGAVATVAKMYSLLLEVKENRIIYSTMKGQKKKYPFSFLLMISVRS
jgi:hypothetical protein